MSLAEIKLLGEAGDVEVLRGWLLIGIACLILLFVLCFWHFNRVARLERKQAEQIRRELARRYDLRHQH